MSRLRTRSGVLAALAGLALAGCVDPPPPPPPDPARMPLYQIATDHCEQLESDEIAAAAGLVVPDGVDEYHQWPGRDGIRASRSCAFRFETPDDRFDDVPMVRGFRASSYTATQVFATPAEAENRYRVLRTNMERMADTIATVTVAPARGWWDEGYVMRRVDELLLDPHYQERYDTSHVTFNRGVRHHNLLLEVTLLAQAPTADLGEVEQLFTDLTQEIADRAMAALELTTVTVTPSPPA